MKKTISDWLIVKYIQRDTVRPTQYKCTIIDYKFIMIKFSQCDELQTSFVTNVAVYME